MSDLVGNPEDRFSHVAAHMTNSLAHYYHLGESFHFRGLRSDFLFHFSMNFLKQNTVCLCPTKRTLG